MRKEQISYQEKMNELRLDLSHPISRKTNFIFVEGESDIKLFRKFFDLDKCKVEHIPGGKIKLEECVELFSKKHPLLIGIRDADFIPLNGEKYDKRNMFLTDYHDIELTMMAQEKVLHALLFEYTNLPKNKHIDFRNKMMKSIEMIGYLKWLNDRENLAFTFKKVGFQHLISFKNGTMDFSAYLKAVIVKSAEPKLVNEPIILEKINQLMANEPDLLLLTNGHDLLKSFAKYFRDYSNAKGLTDEILASAFRIKFSFEDFKETKLYADLKEWADRNKTVLHV